MSEQWVSEREGEWGRWTIQWVDWCCDKWAVMSRHVDWLLQLIVLIELMAETSACGTSIAFRVTSVERKLEQGLSRTVRFLDMVAD